MRDGAAASEVVRRRLEELLGPPDAPAVADDDTAREGRPEPPGAAPAGRLASLGPQAWSFGREHLVAVVVVALAGCGWAAYSMTQARVVPVVAPSVSTPAVAVSATPSAAPQVLVHVLGAVAKPGVVRLPLGSRVQDAIEAAGGLRTDARPGELNLASVVADGSQIVIGSTASPGGEVRGAGGASSSGAGGGGAASGLVNLNTATAAQLDALPGIGPVTAEAILAWRTKHGRFTRVEELNEVDGIGPKTYAQLAPKVTV